MSTIIWSGAIWIYMLTCMANVKIYKCLSHFCASSYRFKDIQIKKKLPSKSWPRSLNTVFAMTPFDVKCQNLQMSSTHFCATSYCFRDIQIYYFKKDKITLYNFLNDALRWQMSKSANVLKTFLRRLYRFSDIKIYFFYLQNVGSHIFHNFLDDSIRRQMSRSINVSKTFLRYVLSFQILFFLNMHVSSKSAHQGLVVQLSQWHHSIERANLQTSPALVLRQF